MTFGFQEKVIDLVCDVMQVDKKCLFVPDRRRRIILAKHLSMYILKKRFGYTLSEIGRVFKTGEKYLDHTTVLHACRTIRNGLDVNQEEVVAPYELVTKRLDKMLQRKMNSPNKLVVTFDPTFNIDGVIKLLRRNFPTLEYEKK
jgi:hypothetical protein